MKIFQHCYRDLINTHLETLKQANPDAVHLTLFRCTTKLAWTNASPEVRKECSEAVEQERREKEELMVLEQEEDSQKRTPEQYSRYVGV